MDDKKRTLDWEDLRIFLQVARRGNLSAAARALKVNHATVSRRLAALEAGLALDLFERRRHGYDLTPAGIRILAAAEAMEAAALSVDDVRQDALVHGRVRFSTVASLAQFFVLPHLKPVLDVHPGLDLEITAEARNVSLALREADMALRLGRPAGSELMGRKVGEVRFGFFAAAGYDGGRRLIAYDTESGFVPEAVWMARTFPHERVVLRSNSHVLQAEAARAGYGIAHLPVYLGLAFGLNPVDFAPAHPPRELWLLTRSEALKTPRVRVCFDAVIEACRHLP